MTNIEFRERSHQYQHFPINKIYGNIEKYEARRRYKRNEKKVLPILKQYGVTRAGLFGSAARGEAGAQSDIDLLVEIKTNISLIDFIHLEHVLEKTLGRDVDLVEYDAIKPALKSYILKDHISLL